MAVKIVPLCVAVSIFAAPSSALGDTATYVDALDTLMLDRSFGLWPLPEAPKLDSRKVELGKRLFHDPILSSTGDVSCASCHDLKSGGDDGRAKSIGATGQPTRRNSPTVYNVSLHSSWFWDGRAESLEDQIDGPITHPDEMGSAWPDIVKRLKSSPQYTRLFRDAYGGDITPATIKNAIATFERTLVTPDSPFDRYLKGDLAALPKDAVTGLNLFKTLGCISCHQGALLGGNLFQKIGIFRKFGLLNRRAKGGAQDFGRYDVTKDDADRYFFKVPSLRNVALTAPYLHDGSAATLEEAVAMMAYYQLGRNLTSGETASLVAFLKSLTASAALSASGKEARNAQSK
ncbi:MAG: cytochrome-c peroxidase [Methyloligellaceae bacterium]